MKNRLTKEVHQTRNEHHKPEQLFKQYRELKEKCVKTVRQHDLVVPELDKFQELQLLFVVDLNLLPLDMLTARRNKLNQAIDSIMLIEQGLEMRILKKKSQQSKDLRDKQEIQPTVTSVEPQEQKNIVQVQRPKKKRTNLFPPSNDYLDPQEITSIRNQYIFDNEQLVNIWNKNRPAAEESVEDKIYRVSKVVASLRRNVKVIVDKEKHTNKNSGVPENTECSQIVRQLEELKEKNKILEQRNKQLEEELSKAKIVQETKQVLGRAAIGHNNSTILYSGQDFKIVKIEQKMGTRHPSLEKKARTFKTGVSPEILRYIFLLQERIVDGLAPKVANYKQKGGNPQSVEVLKKSTSNVQTSTTLTKISSNDMLPSISRLEKPPNVVDETKNLMQMGAKLEEIRRQRKKIFQDDIWDEIENLKL